MEIEHGKLAIHMTTNYRYCCSACGCVESLDMVDWCCPDCGHNWEISYCGEMQMLDLTDVGHGLWRYQSALPLPDDSQPVSLGETTTALTRELFMGISVYVKHEYQLPTGSFKDRGASVLITLARYLGVEPVVEDSSGNAGASIAAYCARAGIPCHIFVPQSTSPSKIRQIELYGATLERIPGPREATARAAEKAATHAFYASHYRHPLFFHGVKTMAFEIWEQMGGHLPRTVVLPVGNGSLLLGLFTGFQELVLAGYPVEMPRLIGVQAGQCAPVVNRFNGADPGDCPLHTIAEGIAIAQPLQMEAIVNAISQTGGAMISVAEEDIITAYKWAWRNGFCIEKTTAVSIAGVVEASTQYQFEDPVLTVFTGHGLKDC